MTTFVATTHIKHGKDDGSVVEFKPGETVKGLGKDKMVELWVADSLAEKGSPRDPSTWPDAAAPTGTTPRFVEDVLLQQLAAQGMGSPDGVEAVATGGAEGRVPSDPEGLLKGTGPGVGDSPVEDSDAPPQQPPTPAAPGETEAAAAAAAEAEAAANKDSAQKKAEKAN